MALRLQPSLLSMSESTNLESQQWYLFDNEAKQEMFNELSKDYISGITLSGGDPLHENNLSEVLSLIEKTRNSFPNKTIWLYTGYTLEQILQPLLINTIPTEEEEKRIDIVKW